MGGANKNNGESLGFSESAAPQCTVTIDSQGKFTRNRCHQNHRCPKITVRKFGPTGNGQAATPKQPCRAAPPLASWSLQACLPLAVAGLAAGWLLAAWLAAPGWLPPGWLPCCKPLRGRHQGCLPLTDRT